jgi:hypothetical protein
MPIKDYKAYWEKRGAVIKARRRAQYRKDPKVRNAARARALVRARQLARARLAKRQLRVEAAVKAMPDTSSRCYVRSIEVGGKVREVVSLRMLAAVLGLSAETLRTSWLPKGVLPRPTVKDDEGRPWFDRAYVKQMARLVVQYRASNWTLKRFAKVLKERWRKC